MCGMTLLADKKSRAWNFATKIKDYLKEEKEKDIPLKEVVLGYFNNKEINAYVPENIRQKDVYFIHDSSKNPQEWWVDLLLLKDLFLNSSARNVVFVLPNMLYNRQDRKDRPHVPISARALADSISPGLSRIITTDLHADQIQGFYPANVPVDSLHSFPEVVRYLRKNKEDLENLVIVSPDAGGANRTRSFLKRLQEAQSADIKKQNYSFALINKARSEPGKIENMELIGKVKGKNALIVDDIIDTGGTLCKAADLLRENGAKRLFCYGTHGIFSKGTKELSKKFERVITSNTCYEEGNGVEIVDLSPLFAEAIYRAQEGLSISKLFE